MNNILSEGAIDTSAIELSPMETNTTPEALVSDSAVPVGDPQNDGLAAILALLAAEGIEVLSLDDCYVRCPGESLHTTPTAISDCKFFVNVIQDALVPRLSCFHCSCGGVVQECNRRLYRAALAGKPRVYQNPLSMTGGGIRRHGIIARPNTPNLQTVLAQFPWTYADILNDAQGKVEEPPELHHFFILSLFDDNDIVWIGRDVQDSGSPGHSWRFRSVKDWYDIYPCPGAFICPSTFKPGVHSRSAANVLKRPYLVVESDVLNRNQVGSVFQWMVAQGHALRAVVDTAGKSLHGWFDYPNPKIIPSLKSDLIALKCDPSMFKPSQPCRLPGGLRDGNFQTLIYFNNTKSLPL